MTGHDAPLRWAILGTGFISNAMIDAISKSTGSTVNAIAGRNPDALSDFSERHHIPRSFVGFEEVVADPEIDAVYIGLPNHVHADLTIAAAEHGKAVLSEKSLTTTMIDAHRLVDTVRDTSFFVEGLMYLSHPLQQAFVGLLTDGRLGALRSIRASYAADIAHLVNPAGMGTLYNLGCYPVSLLQLVVQTMCGEDAFSARQLTGFANRSSSDGNVVDAAASIRFDNGVLASVQSSDTFGNDSEFSVSGEHGTLRFITNPWLPEPGVNSIVWQPFSGQPETISIEDPHDAFYHQLKMVEANVAAGHTESSRPSPRLDDSLEIMALLTEWEAAVR